MPSADCSSCGAEKGCGSGESDQANSFWAWDDDDISYIKYDTSYIIWDEEDISYMPFEDCEWDFAR